MDDLQICHQKLNLALNTFNTFSLEVIEHASKNKDDRLLAIVKLHLENLIRFQQ